MTDETKDGGKVEGWMLVEMMGHHRLAGYVRQVELGAAVMLRVDVPAVTYADRDYDYANGRYVVRETITIAAFTKFVSPNALYALTPCTEEAARAEAERYRVQPVAPAQLPPPEREPTPLLEFANRGSVEDEDDSDDDDERPF